MSNQLLILPFARLRGLWRMSGLAEFLWLSCTAGQWQSMYILCLFAKMVLCLLSKRSSCGHADYMVNFVRSCLGGELQTRRRNRGTQTWGTYFDDLVRSSLKIKMLDHPS